VNRSGGLWRAIAWAEVLLVVGLAAVVFAVASSFESCGFLSGCEPGEDSFGTESVAWLVVSAAAAAMGIFMASWTSGWPRARAVVQATAALLAGAVALWLGGQAAEVLVDEYLPALVLAVGVAGIIAIRPASSRAINARVVVLAILVLLAVGMANAGAVVIGLALLTLPAIGAVESAIGSTEPEVRQPDVS
jgi:hypothetical protein